VGGEVPFTPTPTRGDVVVRVLLVADTHMGLDLPRHPRIERRRRGHDFMANIERALLTALDGQVDLLVHGGDLLFRTRAPAPLVESAMVPLIRVAERGVPVFVVPGNHQRSTLPMTLPTAYPNVHVFRDPGTVALSVRGVTVAVSGFPYVRDAARNFGEKADRYRRRCRSTATP
jgi:DNA repair protein SbcD/Mre11